MLKCIFEKHHVLTTKKTLRNFQSSSFNVWFLPKADFYTVDVKDGAETRLATISSFSVVSSVSPAPASQRIQFYAAQSYSSRIPKNAVTTSPELSNLGNCTLTWLDDYCRCLPHAARDYLAAFTNAFTCVAVSLF